MSPAFPCNAAGGILISNGGCAAAAAPPPPNWQLSAKRRTCFRQSFCFRLAGHWDAAAASLGLQISRKKGLLAHRQLKQAGLSCGQFKNTLWLNSNLPARDAASTSSAIRAIPARKSIVRHASRPSSCRRRRTPPPRHPRPWSPPPTSPAPSAKFSNAVPVTGRRFAGAPSLTGAPPPKPKSKALKTVLIIIAVMVVLAGLGVGGWIGFGKYKERKAAQAAKKENPCRASDRAHLHRHDGGAGHFRSACGLHQFSNRERGRLGYLVLDLSNLTLADVNPDSHANAKTADRHPRGMPQIITNTTKIPSRAHTQLVLLLCRGGGVKS